MSKVTIKQFGTNVRIRRERSTADRERGSTYCIGDDIHVETLDNTTDMWVRVAGYNSTTNDEAHQEADAKARELQKEQSGRGGRGRPLKYPTWNLPLDSANNGVYAIECTATKRTYVGAAADIRARLAQIRTQLQKGAHSCEGLQLDFAVLGPDAFQVRILEVADTCLTSYRNQWVEALIDQGYSLYNERGLPDT